MFFAKPLQRSNLCASHRQRRWLTHGELEVDGSRGKQYRIDVLGDPNQEQMFALSVTYDTGTCT